MASSMPPTPMPNAASRFSFNLPAPLKAWQLGLLLAVTGLAMAMNFRREVERRGEEDDEQADTASRILTWLATGFLGFAALWLLAELARRVTGCVAGLRFNFGDETVAVTASLGIAFSPQQGGDPETLVAAADRAMYVAKGLGGNSWAFAPAESAATSFS